MDGSVRQPPTLAAPLPSIMREGTRDAEPSNLPAFKASVQLIQGVLLSQPDIERSGGVDGVVLEEREEAFEGIHDQPRCPEKLPREIESGGGGGRGRGAELLHFAALLAAAEHCWLLLVVRSRGIQVLLLLLY